MKDWRRCVSIQRENTLMRCEVLFITGNKQETRRCTRGVMQTPSRRFVSTSADIIRSASSNNSSRTAAKPKESFTYPPPWKEKEKMSELAEVCQNQTRCRHSLDLHDHFFFIRHAGTRSPWSQKKAEHWADSFSLITSFIVKVLIVVLFYFFS